MVDNNVEAYLSPRMQLCPPNDQMQFMDAAGTTLEPDGTMCLKMIDTEREKKIDLGVSWPFEKLEYGECIVAADLAEKGVKVGDTV